MQQTHNILEDRDWGKDCPDSGGLLGILSAMELELAQGRYSGISSVEWQCVNLGNLCSSKLWHLTNDECILCICSPSAKESHINKNNIYPIVQFVIIRNWYANLHLYNTIPIECLYDGAVLAMPTRYLEFETSWNLVLGIYSINIWYKDKGQYSWEEIDISTVS